MNEYDYGNFDAQQEDIVLEEQPLFQRTDDGPSVVDVTKPEIASLPRVLMMGPRRAGKTSIQVRYQWYSVKDSYNFFRSLENYFSENDTTRNSISAGTHSQGGTVPGQSYSTL